MEIRLSESEVRDILAEWVTENQGVTVTGKDVAFAISAGYEGDVREPSRPAALAGATVKVPASPRRKRDPDDILRG